MLMFTFQPFHQSFLFLLLKQQSSFYLFCTEFSEAWPNPCLQANLWTPVGPTIKSLEIAALHSTQHASVLTLYRGSSKASFLFLFTWMASSWTRWALCSFSFADSGALSPALWHHYVDYLYVICYDFRYLFYRVFFFLWIQPEGCKSAILRSFKQFLYFLHSKIWAHFHFGTFDP